jgi:type IV pilus assembly protein PilB
MRKRIGQCLIQSGLISRDNLRAALAEQRISGRHLGAVLVDMQLATEQQIAAALAAQLGFPFAALAGNPSDPRAIVLIPKELAQQQLCVAVALERDVLTIAMADPLALTLVEDLGRRTGLRIRPVVATRSDILDAIDGGYPDVSPPHEGPLREADRTQEAVVADSPSIRDLVDRIVADAAAGGATDVHIEPGDDCTIVRVRIDGMLKTAVKLPRTIHGPLIAELKARAGMDDTSLPQEGRESVDSGRGRVHFRVTSLRTIAGEKLVMRPLAPLDHLPALSELGMSDAAMEQLRQCLAAQRGLLMVAGPRCSGRTTTIGALLRLFDADATNIATLEDRITYRIPGVTQTLLQDSEGTNVSSALDAVLASDPDVVAIDVPDVDAAAAAIRAAQSGRLTLCALDATDTAGSVARLLDAGSEPLAVASALAGVVAQRLVRRLCANCRREYHPSSDRLQRLGIPAVDDGVVLYQAVGCDLCSYTGYRGRTGLFEVMRVTDRLRRSVAEDSAESRIAETAAGGGMTTLFEHGLSRVRAGMTTVEELERVSGGGEGARTLCGECGTILRGDFAACPRCGTSRASRCAHCARTLQPGWNFCPYCTRRIEKADNRLTPR